MIQQLVKNPENGIKNSIKKQDSTDAARQAADRKVAGISMNGVHIKMEASFSSFSKSSCRHSDFP